MFVVCSPPIHDHHLIFQEYQESSYCCHAPGNKTADFKSHEQWAFQGLQENARNQFGLNLQTSGGFTPIPVFLVCNVCGNVQYFRFDLTSDKSGQKWNP